MRRELARRIERLEQRAAINADPPPRNIFLCFTDDQAANHAKSGAREWQRWPDEEQLEFEDRIVADLKAARVTPPFAVMLFNFDS
jgi:hypothetical protein